MTRHEVPPLSDGLYYATPVLLADCSESEESDTDTDAQTVIHTSPYSSPGCSQHQISDRLASEKRRDRQIFDDHPPHNLPLTQVELFRGQPQQCSPPFRHHL